MSHCRHFGQPSICPPVMNGCVAFSTSCAMPCHPHRRSSHLTLPLISRPFSCLKMYDSRDTTRTIRDARSRSLCAAVFRRVPCRLCACGLRELRQGAFDGAYGALCCSYLNPPCRRLICSTSDGCATSILLGRSTENGRSNIDVSIMNAAGFFTMPNRLFHFF